MMSAAPDALSERAGLLRWGSTSIGWVLAFLFIPVCPAKASNTRTTCLFNWYGVSIALRAYKTEHGDWPSDIHDPQGRPLLSWRVRLLFHLDRSLHSELRLDEPWDSAHNLKALDKIPYDFRCSGLNLTGGRTTVLLLKRTTTDAGDRGPRVVAVEADEAFAVPWTKPEDLTYDPATPNRGLGRRHYAGFFREPGCFAIFADGMVRFLPADSDEALLRELLSANADDKVKLSYSWDEALTMKPVGQLIGGYLLLWTISFLGLVFVVPRLLRRKPISPGEMLWVITGVSFLAHAIAVMAWYSYEPFPIVGTESVKFWVVPAVAAGVVSLFAAIWYRSDQNWRTLFLVNLFFFGLIVLDANVPQQHQTAEDSFVTAVTPVWLGFLGMLVAGRTLARREIFRDIGRRLPHWIGIAATLLPLVWLIYWKVQGLSGPGLLFARIVD